MIYRSKPAAKMPVTTQVTVDPALCVALGAAMYGGALEGTLPGAVELADGAYRWDLHERVTGLQA